METLWRGLLLLAVLNVALAEDKPTYVKNGGNLTLDLEPAPSEPITNILWKIDGNLLAEWIKDIYPVEYYSSFRGRSTLNNITGRLIIDKMSKSDTGLYSVEVNDKVQSERYNVKVIEEVSKPGVEVKPLVCGPTTEQCKLICESGNPEAEPVTYSWKKDDGDCPEPGNELPIMKTRNTSVKTFTCRATNPLGSKESEPFRILILEGKPEDSEVCIKVLGAVMRSVALLALLAAAVYLVWLNRGTVGERMCLCCRRKGDGEAAEGGRPHSYVNDGEEMS